ncbi:cytochrome oxidase putative small subunit CydP [Rickettsiales bacterium LUAb2]
MKLYKEIILVLCIKAILLTALWYFSFRDPIKLNDQKAGNYIIYNQE